MLSREGWPLDWRARTKMEASSCLHGFNEFFTQRFSLAKIFKCQILWQRCTYNWRFFFRSFFSAKHIETTQTVQTFDTWRVRWLESSLGCEIRRGEGGWLLFMERIPCQIPQKMEKLLLFPLILFRTNFHLKKPLSKEKFKNYFNSHFFPQFFRIFSKFYQHAFSSLRLLPVRYPELNQSKIFLTVLWQND